MSVVLPPMSRRQGEAWNGLLDLSERHPTGWTLVGGQMVHLHCIERGIAPMRPTNDVDTVLDVRAEPGSLQSFTAALVEVGFSSTGESWEGHQHRWQRGGAQIDILIPRHLGERAAGRRGVSGETTIETPGAQQALDRTQPVEVVLDGRTGWVRRPSLLGALVAKAAAHSVVLDRARSRHLIDFAVLTTLIRPSDVVHEAGRRDRERLGTMLAALAADRRTWAGVDGADDGIARLHLALAPAPAARAAEADPFARQPRSDPDPRVVVVWGCGSFAGPQLAVFR